MSLFWNLMYLFRPPWDTGRPQPALVEWLERTRPRPGRALDLGCGTGTNAIYLARYGFQVTGVDIARLAIARSRRKARRAGVQARFLVADVTDLPPDLGPFDLALDVGCFHSLDEQARRGYAASLRRVLAPGGVFLLYVFLRQEGGPRRPGPRGVTPEEVRALFRDGFRLLDEQPRADWRPAAFYVWQRAEAP